MDSIRQIMEEEGHDIEINVELIKSIRDYNQSFMTRNEDHIQFFGGMLTGVHTVRFKSIDRDMWFDLIMDGFDERSAYQRVVRLPTLKPEWKRATDVMNLSCIWLCHKFLTATHLKDTDRQEGMRQVLITLNNKYLTSLLVNYFKYPADPAAARATVDRMSNKFLLKQYGSWRALMEHRANDIIRPSGPQFKAIKYFDDDKEIIDAVQDIQLRIRQFIKGVWQEFNIVNTTNSKISVSKTMINLDGETVVRDVSRNETKYLRYIQTVLQDQTRFFKEELIDIIVSISPTMPPVPFRELLIHVQKNAANPKEKDIEELINEIILHATEYLRRSPETRRMVHNVGDLAARLRANYMSSRSTDKSLIKMRTMGERLIKRSTKLKSESAVSAVRTGFFLYIVLRTYSMSHYN